MRASVPLENTNLTVLLNLFLSFFCFYLLSVYTLAANVLQIGDGRLNALQWTLVRILN